MPGPFRPISWKVETGEGTIFPYINFLFSGVNHRENLTILYKNKKLFSLLAYSTQNVKVLLILVRRQVLTWQSSYGLTYKLELWRSPINPTRTYRWTRWLFPMHMRLWWCRLTVVTGEIGLMYILKCCLHQFPPTFCSHSSLRVNRDRRHDKTRTHPAWLPIYLLLMCLFMI